MKKRLARYIASKNKVISDIIRREDQVRSNPDPNIDQDFPGFPDAPSTDSMIDPKTKEERAVAGLDIKDDEKAMRHNESFQ